MVFVAKLLTIHGKAYLFAPNRDFPLRRKTQPLTLTPSHARSHGRQTHARPEPGVRNRLLVRPSGAMILHDLRSTTR